MHSLIVLGGEKPSESLIREVAGKCDFIIAADSGFHAFDDLGILPHLLVGDFDSIKCNWRSDSVKVIHAPEQNATDFQKALRYLPEETTQLTILGGTGLRSDHFLTNLLIASSVSKSVEIKFIDDLQVIHRILPSQSFKDELAIGKIVSLIPFSSCDGVSTKGLKWNLSNSTMGISKQLGQSNIVEAKEVEVSIKGGVLYFIVNF